MAELIDSRRLGHPAALRAFRELLGRSDVDKELVFLATCERLRTPTGDELGAIRDALTACARDLGVRVPSAAQYDAWQRLSPAGRGALPIGRLRRVCGSWSNALTLIDVPAADPTRRQLLAYGRRFSREQALAALAAFLADLATDEPPSLGRYLEWASAVPRNADGRTRVPRNEHAFLRLFGSWNSALVAAGADPARVGVRSRPRARCFLRADAAATLRAAHAELGEPLGETRYDRWVRERDRAIARAASSDLQPAPFATTVANLYGGWRAAQRAVLGDQVVLARRTRPYDYSEEEMLALYRACMRDIGHPPSAQEWDVWRLRHRSHDGGNSAPHSNTMARRLGTGRWSSVAAQAGQSLPRSRGPRSHFTREQLVEAWQACTRVMGHEPSQSEYDGWREQQLEADRVTPVPSWGTLARRLGGGSWSAIPRALGYATSSPLAARPPYTDAQLAGAWRACRDALGGPPGLEKYCGWRARRLRIKPGDGPLPAANTLLKRLGGGSWRGVARFVDSINDCADDGSAP